jgi:hypothetical protein
VSCYLNLQGKFPFVPTPDIITCFSFHTVLSIGPSDFKVAVHIQLESPTQMFEHPFEQKMGPARCSFQDLCSSLPKVFFFIDTFSAPESHFPKNPFLD